MYARPVERSHPAFRHSPEVRTNCGRFTPDEIRRLGFAVDIRQLGASEEFFEQALEARAAEVEDVEIRARAAELARQIAEDDARAAAAEVNA